MEHTPTPWEKWSLPNGGHIWCGSKHIADTNGNNALANAEHIVKCVNNYDILIEALKEAYSSNPERSAALLVQVREILAEAGS